MRIVQVIDSLDVGGAQRLQLTLAAGLQNRPVELTVVSFGDDRHSPIPDQLTTLGASVHRFNARNLSDHRRFRRLTHFLRASHFDIMQTHLTTANVIGVLAARIAGIPAIGTLHSAGIDPLRQRTLHRHLETLTLRYGVRTSVAVGYQVAQVHQARLGRHRITVVPNAVAMPPPLAAADRHRVRAEVTGDPSVPVVISVGRLARPKGYFDLLRAFAQTRQDHPTAVLLIVGGGELHKALLRSIDEFGLGSGVRLLGSRNDVSTLLAASDLYVSSSHWEGLPVAVLEAMAAGLPVVATDVGDVPRVLIEGTGLIVPAKSPERLAEAMSALLGDPARRQTLGAEARAHVSTNYSVGPWIDRLLTLYCEASTQSADRHHPLEVR